MMFPDLAGKACLVTGASRGIGAAVALALGRNRARVAVHYRGAREAAEGIVREIQGAGGEAFALQGDLTGRETAAMLVGRAVEAFGGIDVLVNNAGDLIDRRPLAETSDEIFDAHVALNVYPVFAACRAAVPAMRERGGGAIVNAVSIAARTGGGGGSSLYAGAKAFTVAMTRALAKEVAQDGIRANAVAPGVIETDLLERTTTQEALAGIREQIPLKRIGTPDECVGTFLFLASREASGYLTGQVIDVNGGLYMS